MSPGRPTYRVPASEVRILGVALIAAAALACTPSAPASPSPGATAVAPSPSLSSAPTNGPTPVLIHRHISGQGFGLSFDYPSDWHDVGYPYFFLAAYTNGDDSALVPICCHLNPNQLAVSIAYGGAVPVDIGGFKSPEFDVRSVGDWLVVRQTMPATPSNFVDVHTLWLIGRPGGDRVYSISAIFRGPNLAPMEAQVDAFVDSIKLDPKPAASPS